MKTIIHGLIILIIAICLYFFFSFKFNATSIEKELAQSNKKSVTKSPLSISQQRPETLSNKLEIQNTELEAKLHDKNPYNVSEAIVILEQKGGIESIERLEELFNSPTPSIIIDSVAALGRMQAKEAIDNLEKLYTNT